MSKKYFIKIPQNIILYYSEKNQLLIVKGPLKTKSLELKLKIIISKNKKVIKVLKKTFKKVSNNEKKRLKVLQGTFLAILKQVFYDVSILSFKKLKLIGVGYKVFLIKVFNKTLLKLKVGYSHDIFYRIPDNFNTICLKSNSKIYISGNFYQHIAQVVAQIRSYKIPEPYKGKGILHDNEQLTIKEGKKI